ncbi:DUF4269 domain-containing protein [Paenibacillus spongiae]|uniref:DUF4269 domain-containing protein n=1 Tax=Paenibacillus spongiae TaxID=2909671 RepID=A0ABY5SGP6_9BACL|nr:DUF4269 domain-containing protein [Paenibacillus spongiae]UVI32753.1 DUF4269 domain-containing protein [Paenibacillus spongiae]
MIYHENRFFSLDYLSVGNDRQKHAYRVLNELGTLESLQPYHPLLVGTVPIGIDIAGSDLDIICEARDMDRFEETVKQLYQTYENYRLRRRSVHGIERIVAGFTYEGWPIEIFGQPVVTTHQNGFRHMVVEYRILEALNDEGKARIRQLKETGLGTEPAFGVYLSIQDDPYPFLLRMYDWEDEELLAFLHNLSKDMKA